MTELLYQTDSYLNDFEALVTAVTSKIAVWSWTGRLSTPAGEASRPTRGSLELET
jgi:hypothetical protein